MSKYSDNMPPDLKDAIGWMLDDIKENKTLLDFGCSTGYFGEFIKKTKHNKVYGVEIGSDKEQAKKVLDGVYSFDLDGNWPAEIYERQYDYLFFGDVIEHLKDPAKTLEKSYKLLKPGGLAFISTPNIAHISIRLELLSGNFEYEPMGMGILDDTHLKYFTKKSLIELVEKAGFRIKSIDFSANDYSDEIIRELLAKSGLKPTEKFWDEVNKPEARAYQYKLVIEPQSSKKVASNTKVKSLAEKPEFFRNAATDDLKQKVKVLHQHAKEQAKIIDHYVSENKDLAQRLKGRELSRLYKIANKTKKILKK